MGILIQAILHLIGGVFLPAALTTLAVPVGQPPARPHRRRLSRAAAGVIVSFSFANPRPPWKPLNIPTRPWRGKK